MKVCKAANKSVLPDAIDNENTAVTIAGMKYCYISKTKKKKKHTLFEKLEAKILRTWLQKKLIY